MFKMYDAERISYSDLDDSLLSDNEKEKYQHLSLKHILYRYRIVDDNFTAYFLGSGAGSSGWKHLLIGVIEAYETRGKQVVSNLIQLRKLGYGTIYMLDYLLEVAQERPEFKKYVDCFKKRIDK